MAQFDQVATSRQESALSTNKVLRNTYMLLSLTLVVSAVAAVASMAMGLPHGAALVMSLAAIGIVWFVLPRTYEKASGIYWVFGFSALMGASLGPMLSFYAALNPSIIIQAFAGTAIVTFGLSAYAVTTKKDFSFLGGFLMVGVIVLLLAMLANIFFAMPALSIGISAAAVLIFSLLILYDTSRIVNGGETNYVRATVSLYLDIYNLFVHLLHLVAVLTGGDD